MKKLLSIILTLSILMGLCTIPVQAEDNIRVMLNGQEIAFDVPPQIISDRTMVPMRAIFEALGYEVNWKGESGTITAENRQADKWILMIINNPLMNVCSYSDFLKYGDDSQFLFDSTKVLDAAPVIVDGRTLVPVRAISEASGYNVEWDGYSRTVRISNSKTPSNFDILKNIITSQGKYDDSYNWYIINSSTRMPGVSLSMLYETVSNFIAFTLIDDEDSYKIKLYLYLEPDDRDPHIYMTLTYNSNAGNALAGRQYSLSGALAKNSGKFIKGESNFPNAAIESAYIDQIYPMIETFEALLTVYDTNLTLSDFGIVTDKTNTSNEQASPMDKLKNMLMTKGVYNDDAKMYSLNIDGVTTEKINTKIIYYVEQETIVFAYNVENSGTEMQVHLHIKDNDEEPFVMVRANFESDSYILTGNISNRTHKFIKGQSNMSSTMESSLTKTMNSAFEIFDLCLRSYNVGATLADLGVLY